MEWIENVYVKREYSWVLPVNAVAKEAVCGVGSRCCIIILILVGSNF